MTKNFKEDIEKRMSEKERAVFNRQRIRVLAEQLFSENGNAKERDKNILINLKNTMLASIVKGEPIEVSFKTELSKDNTIIVGMECKTSADDFFESLASMKIEDILQKLTFQMAHNLKEDTFLNIVNEMKSMGFRE